MKLKQKLASGFLFIAIALVGLVVTSDSVNALPSCGGVDTSIIACEQTGGSTNTEDTGLWGILMLVINIMSAGVGILAVGGIVYASIKYAMSGGSPEKAKEAKVMIANTVVGLIAFALMFSLLNFLVPGGLFR